MSDENISTGDVNPSKWALQLGVAAIAIVIGTALLFYFTTRGIFGRAANTQGLAVDPQLNVVNLDHGLKVYATQCAMCHGAAGLGDGQAAAQLNPRPRDFSSGTFKIGSTKSGFPTDEDLAAAIRHGLPPTMPPWPQLSDGEVKSVALAVKHLAIEGRVTRKLARDAKFSREEAVKEARARLDSGPVFELPPKPAKIDLARGKEFYMNNCAACHDPDGRAVLREDLVDNDERPIAARNLTTGQFKGGNSMEEIALRIVRGIPGSPMPAPVEISPDDLWATSAYVRSLFENASAPPSTMASAKTADGAATRPASSQ